MSKRGYKALISIMLLVAMWSGSAYAQQPQSNLVKFIVENRVSADANYSKGLTLFSKKAYGAALMEFEKALSRGRMPISQIETVRFITAICKSKLMKENSLRVIDSYILESKNMAFRNEAMLIAAEEIINIGDIETAAQIIAAIDIKLLDKVSAYNYYYVSGYIKLVSGDENGAFSDFNQCLGKGSTKTEASQYYIAYIDYKRGNFSEALGIFTELAKNDKYIEANLYILQIRFQLQEFKTCVTEGVLLLNMPLSDMAKLEVVRIIGESYFNLANYVQAVANIEKYEKGGGKMNRELYYQLGYGYYMQNMYKASIEQFVKIVEGSDALVQNAYYHLADAYLKVGNKSGAMLAFSMASQFSFEKKITEDALYNYAKLTYESTSSALYSKKIDVLKKYIATYPSTPRSEEMREYLLTLYLNSSNFDAAMAELVKVKKPNDEIKAAVQRLCYQKANDYFNLGDYKKAIELYDKSLSYPVATKYDALASFWKAEAMFKSGDYSWTVVNLYNKYLRVAQPSMREYKMAHYNIAYVHFNNEKWAQAVDAFDKFLTIYSTKDGYREDALVRRGDALFANKNYDKARDSYKNSVDVGALNSDYAYYQIALSEGLMGKNDLKIETLKLISGNRNSSYSDRATIELAATYIKTRKFKQGIDVLEAMIEERENSLLLPDALLELGVAYVNSGDDNKALSSYKEVVKTYPQSSPAKDALVAIKAIYVSKGDVNTYFKYIASMGAGGEVDAGERERMTYDAIQRQYIDGNYTQVIELADNYNGEFDNGVHLMDVAYYLSEALINSGSERAAAQIEFIIAAPMNQYTIHTLQNGVALYAKQNNKEKQHEMLTKIYTVSTTPAEKYAALESMIEIASQLSNEQVVTDSYELVFADKGASERAKEYALYVRGMQHYNKGRNKEAIEDLKKVNIAFTKAEGIFTQFMIADAYFRLGDMDSSEKKILQMAEIETPHQYWVARGFILYGDIYVKKGDLFQAKATYQSVLDGYEKNTDGILDRVKKKLEEINKIEVKEETKSENASK